MKWIFCSSLVVALAYFSLFAVVRTAVTPDLIIAQNGKTSASVVVTPHVETWGKRGE